MEDQAQREKIAIYVRARRFRVYPISVTCVYKWVWSPTLQYQKVVQREIDRHWWLIKRTKQGISKKTSLVVNDMSTCIK